MQKAEERVRRRWRKGKGAPTRFGFSNLVSRDMGLRREKNANAGFRPNLRKKNTTPTPRGARRLKPKQFFI